MAHEFRFDDPQYQAAVTVVVQVLLYFMTTDVFDQVHAHVVSREFFGRAEPGYETGVCRAIHAI